MDLTELVRTKAYELGAEEIGICQAKALPKNLTSLNKMLSGCRSVVCIMFAHSETALASSDIYLKQYETSFCYSEVTRISQQLARYLEREGHQAVAVPAFLPLDMADGKMGMVGAVDWRQAAVESGLAIWGKNGLAVHPRFGPRMRLGGLITTAQLETDYKLDFSPCGNCQICIEACPAKALLGDGEVDKQRCGKCILTYGLRAFTRLLRETAMAESEANIK